MREFAGVNHEGVPSCFQALEAQGRARIPRSIGRGCSPRLAHRAGPGSCSRRCPISTRRTLTDPGLLLLRNETSRSVCFTRSFVNDTSAVGVTVSVLGGVSCGTHRAVSPGLTSSTGRLRPGRSPRLGCCFPEEKRMHLKAQRKINFKTLQIVGGNGLL